MKTYVGKQQRLELDVDMRIADVWGVVDEVDKWTLRLAGEFMRCAYVRGYEHALTEMTRGLLYRDNGYSVPTRRAA